MKQCLLIACIWGIFSCDLLLGRSRPVSVNASDSSHAYARLDSFEGMEEREPPKAAETSAPYSGGDINTKGVKPADVVAFAQTLLGVPYKYAASDPAVGFDCSGFITYVFSHFDISVPRSSIDFTNVGRELPHASALPGDLILFTGTDSTNRHVGHMGLIVSNGREGLRFIHSSSGKKANGVVITPLNEYYLGRYVKTVRIFE